MTVVTRFAPSPTGMLHIGGARTALFNFLLAKHNQGKFLLRIEDTDKARSTEEATQAILEGMSWLGLVSDEPPVLQSSRAARHQEVAQQMLDSGAAFKCCTTPEELAERRELGETKRQESKNQDLTEAERTKLAEEANALLAPYRSPYRDQNASNCPKTPHTVRLRAPDSGTITVDDGVQGSVSIQASEIDDLILLRADGTPTYMLAVVVDDHDMGVTDVIRGDDHFRNTFRQLPIFEAMGWDIPKYSHVPLIHGPDGKKLSKRHGALSTLAYRDMGYLPEAMNAYLLRLGWSHGDQEIFKQDEAIAKFSTAGLNQAPARLDFDKLNATNAAFIKEVDNEWLLTQLLTIIEKNTKLTPDEITRIKTALPSMKDRGATLPELATAFDFLICKRPLELNKKARKTLSGEGALRLAGLTRNLESLPEWTEQRLAAAIADFCEAENLSMGQVGSPLRAALTGGRPAPDIAPVLAWLGRAEALGRIQDQISGTDA